jgi:hypothetical protein
MKDIPIIKVDTDGMEPGATVVDIHGGDDSTPMFDLVVRLLWDLFAIVGVIAVVVALAFWLGWERYHHLLEAERPSVTVPDCGSCRKGQSK